MQSTAQHKFGLVLALLGLFGLASAGLALAGVGAQSGLSWIFLAWGALLAGSLSWAGLYVPLYLVVCGVALFRGRLTLRALALLSLAMVPAFFAGLTLRLMLGPDFRDAYLPGWMAANLTHPGAVVASAALSLLGLLAILQAAVRQPAPRGPAERGGPTRGADGGERRPRPAAAPAEAAPEPPADAVEAFSQAMEGKLESRIRPGRPDPVDLDAPLDDDELKQVWREEPEPLAAAFAESPSKRRPMFYDPAAGDDDEDPEAEAGRTGALEIYFSKEGGISDYPPRGRHSFLTVAPDIEDAESVPAPRTGAPSAIAPDVDDDAIELTDDDLLDDSAATAGRAEAAGMAEAAGEGGGRPPVQTAASAGAVFGDGGDDNEGDNDDENFGDGEYEDAPDEFDDADDGEPPAGAGPAANRPAAAFDEPVAGGVGAAPAAGGRAESGAAAGPARAEAAAVPPGPARPADDAVDTSLLPPLEAPKPWERGGAYSVPITGLLEEPKNHQYWVIDDLTTRAASILKQTLEEFGIAADVTGIRKGPVITMFEILPAPGVKLAKIVNLADNIALRLAAQSVRIVAPIPGKHAVGIEIPNKERAVVSFSELLMAEGFRAAKVEIPVALGKDIAGDAQIVDLTKTPHLLIAGATGSGKSVCVNGLICSILYRRSPAEVKMILIDPKIVELKFYNDIPHLLTPVITDPKKAFQALQWCLFEMERRYSLLDAMQVRDIKSYNKKIKARSIATPHLPYLVVVIDEFADLMATSGKELEGTLARLAAMSRAVGIHLVLATQRPSADVITGLIKANIPSRIAFMVASKIDSRIIIDGMGAEKLLGKGDMLFTSAWDPFPFRMQGAFLSEEEVERVVGHVKTLGQPDYIDDEIFFDAEDDEMDDEDIVDAADDPLLKEAIDIVVSAKKASASYLQRRLKVGYNRAARMIEQMEEMGIVGPSQGSKPREILRMFQ